MLDALHTTYFKDHVNKQNKIVDVGVYGRSFSTSCNTSGHSLPRKSLEVRALYELSSNMTHCFFVLLTSREKVKYDCQDVKYELVTYC